jgi:nitrogen fixation NifU-like protein
MSLTDLYQEMILDHSKYPRNLGELPHANHHQQGYNPLCGDKLTVFISEANGVIEDIHFTGNGCAISVASASLMTEALKGKTLAEFTSLFNAFHDLMVLKKQTNVLGKLEVLSGVAEFPMRVKCATLAWHTAKAALANDPHTVKTEE